MILFPKWQEGSEEILFKHCNSERLVGGGEYARGLLLKKNDAKIKG